MDLTRSGVRRVSAGKQIINKNTISREIDSMYIHTSRMIETESLTYAGPFSNSSARLQAALAGRPRRHIGTDAHGQTSAFRRARLRPTFRAKPRLRREHRSLPLPADAELARARAAAPVDLRSPWAPAPDSLSRALIVLRPNSCTRRRPTWWLGARRGCRRQTRLLVPLLCGRRPAQLLLGYLRVFRRFNAAPPVHFKLHYPSISTFHHTSS